jgi:ketosteroid isomerase-like protein
MKAFKSLALAAVLSLAVGGAAQAQQTPTVQELANRWTAAYNQGNSDQVAALYSPAAELYIHREGRYAGRADIRDYWASDMRRSNPITVLTVTDSVIDAEMMLVHGNYQVLDRRTGVPQGAGRFAHIWVRSGAGQWSLDRDVWVDLTE